MAGHITGGPDSGSVDAILSRALATPPAAPARTSNPAYRNDMLAVSADSSRLARSLAMSDASQFTPQFVKWAQDLRSAVDASDSVDDIRGVMQSLNQIQGMPEVDKLPTNFEHLHDSVVGYIQQHRPDLYQAAHSQGVL